MKSIPLFKDLKNIRNFSIIAHIDHGKSTLSDRLLQITHTVDKREFHNQMLDSMDIEQERGITIKAQCATIFYTARDGNKYALNLIDTPGHVDFSYEVSRALMACEGVLLIVDASQGVEAQTIANMYQAIEHNLEIVPVINKIDLPSADIEDTKHQIEHDLGLDSSIAVPVSAKEGIGIEDVIEAVIQYCPAPQGNVNNPLKALIFDAKYDTYRGVNIYVRIFDGTVKAGDEISFFQTGEVYKVEEVGILQITQNPVDCLYPGMVGYIIANIKSLEDTKIGDTVTLSNRKCTEQLPGFKEVKPFVFCSIFPADGDDYKMLTDSLHKLKLNDASLTFAPESSLALGFGYRCGFLGLLHLEIVQERLEREFDLDIVTTAPSVEYKFELTSGESIDVNNPVNYPDQTRIKCAYEPYVIVNVITPEEYVGNIMKVIMDRRGIQKHMHYLDKKRIQMDYEMPLAEIVYDFQDKIKSVSRGYASFDYHFIDLRASDLVKVDILVNKKKVDALSMIMHREKSQVRSRIIVEKLKENIPRHMFQIPIQASVNNNVIARENVSALRKNVTAKCYGGDISRKRKLLEKQKKGKKRMRQIGNVEIPQEAFMSILKTDIE